MNIFMSRFLFLLIKDLPKAIVFKTISMQFTPTVSENKESEDIDDTQLIRMSSEDLIRLKKARKADQMFVTSLVLSFYLKLF